MIEYKTINNKTRYAISFKQKKHYNYCIRIQEKRKLLWIFPYWRTRYKEFLNVYKGPADGVGYGEKWLIYHGWILWNLGKISESQLGMVLQQTYTNYQNYCFKDNFKNFKNFTKDLVQDQFIL